nr:hypothetical protein [Tanacetum cinerariifolium]
MLLDGVGSDVFEDTAEAEITTVLAGAVKLTVYTVRLPGAWLSMAGGQVSSWHNLDSRCCRAVVAEVQGIAIRRASRCIRGRGANARRQVSSIG